MTGIAKGTVAKLAVEIGRACVCEVDGLFQSGKGPLI